MSLVAIIVDPNDNKVKIDRLYLMKTDLGTVQGDQFLYKILEVGYKYSSYCYSNSPLILRSTLQSGSFILYNSV